MQGNGRPWRRTGRRKRKAEPADKLASDCQARSLSHSLLSFLSNTTCMASGITKNSFLHSLPRASCRTGDLTFVRGNGSRFLSLSGHHYVCSEGHARLSALVASFASCSTAISSLVCLSELVLLWRNQKVSHDYFVLCNWKRLAAEAFTNSEVSSSASCFSASCRFFSVHREWLPIPFLSDQNEEKELAWSSLTVMVPRESLAAPPPGGAHARQQPSRVMKELTLFRPKQFWLLLHEAQKHSKNGIQV